MLFNIAVKHGGPCLLVIGSGEAQLCDLFALIDVAARVARMKDYRRVLADVLAVDPQLSEAEFAEVGRHAATTLAGIERVAVVVARNRSTTQNAARDAGLNMRMFSDLHRAEAWLAERA